MLFRSRTRESETSASTDLSAIYEGADNAQILGVSGTVLGLQQLIASRTGAGKIYLITGGRANFGGIKAVKVANSHDAKVKEVKDSIIDGLSRGENILLLAKTAPSVAVFMEAIKSILAEGGNTAKQLDGYTIYDRTAGASGVKYTIDDGQLSDEQQLGSTTDGKGETIDETSRDALAKAKNLERKIIIDNDAGATGVDYQGDYTLAVLDSHLYSNTDLAQLLQRIGRPNPDGTGRGAAVRFIIQDSNAVVAHIESVLADAKFTEFFERAIKGQEGKFLADPMAERLFDNLITGNAETGYQLVSGKGYKGGDVQYQRDILELLTFLRLDRKSVV